MDRAKAFQAIYEKWQRKVNAVRKEHTLQGNNNYNHITNNLLNMMSIGCNIDELKIERGSNSWYTMVKNFLHGAKWLRKYMKLIDSSSDFRAGEFSGQYFSDIRAVTTPEDEWHPTNPNERRDGLENYISQAEEILWLSANFR